ncbi:MAG: carboxypeptidase-like regulatory domain-containing protein [Acidobacteriota bacterium]|nr:carboxypeptidase-like regulatory domain-containing protein [Acidobacteriota bacterium]
MNKLLAAAAFAALSLPCAFAQVPCRASSLWGVVRDGTMAVIPQAAVSLDGGAPAVSDAEGKFRLLCVADGPHRISVRAEGFAAVEVRVTAPHSAELELVLKLAEVRTQMDVSATQDGAAVSAAASGPTQTIEGKALQSLADDPDDLLRELQQLAAAMGGSPSAVTVAVDGFQGSSALPPKSSIAYIKVNPDQFSAEYREPPFGGARVEVYTKPGQKTYHGALFLTNGSPWENARDPFSTSRAALGKQRFGFELTGPVRRVGSDFALTFEHRSIDNFAVVNAVTLDAAGAEVNTSSNVATPQRLWLGTARLDWQLGAKNTLIASYSAHVNHLQNLGVGGGSLAETGYDSQTYEHMARLSEITTVSPRAMHESRLSLRWDGEGDSPGSSAPQVQVAGAFTGGGASIGAKRVRELNVEWDDDAILTPKNHTIKLGTQMMVYGERRDLPSNFNGTYTFGGGTAPLLDAGGRAEPGQSVTITGIEQYRRAQLGLPGGTPTAFTNVTGTPRVAFTQIEEALFFQDDWNAGHGVHVAYGVRYYLQNDPETFGAFVPRLGVLWSPGSKARWTVHAHAGMFSGRFGPGVAAEVAREDGAERVTSLVYNPVYGDPFAGAVPIHTRREFAPHVSNLSWAAENVGATRALPAGFNLSFDYYVGRIWNETRTVNINSPKDGSPYGPRPGLANENVLQVQNSGQGRVNATFLGIEQHTLKHVQFFFGGLRLNLLDDTDDDEFSSPQSAYSNAGEFARRSRQNGWELFGNASVSLPGKVQWSADFNGGGDAHYNITTGFDNNGDGVFNDRPQYAAVGTPGAVSTPWGLLVASGGTGVFPRNKGVMPWTYYLDMNAERTFTMTHNAKAEHQQKVTLNVRSSNVLNHQNVTAVGGVLGSPQFGKAVTADNGRRVEAGVRYSF